MSQKKILIKGAFILTVTGFATRIIGFFYRIFLSRSFGEESVGLYQLIFPVYALGISLTCAGIQTAISRCVAGKSAVGRHDQARQLLYTGVSLSAALSIAVMLLTQKYADFIALRLLCEERCSPLLIVLSYAFPFASVHSCICGYYICIYMLRYRQRIFCPPAKSSGRSFRLTLAELLRLSVPLTANRILLNILQSIEAVSIPIQLRTYGMDTSHSLSMYGVLTGMALPCVMFPSAVTNSIAAMMLPAIAELQAADRRQEMHRLIKKAAGGCFLLGSVCCIGLLITGRFIGNYIFHSSMAGDFIITLAWICPFLYTNSNLISIINGLGKTSQSFLFNTVSLTLRILSVFLCVPFFGINGYLWGLLASQLLLFLLCLYYLTKRSHIL